MSYEPHDLRHDVVRAFSDYTDQVDALFARGLPRAPVAPPPSVPLPVFPAIRAPSRDQLIDILADPTVHEALAELVPLLKVSDVLPCLQAPGLAELLVPCLSPEQCKLVGPELAELVGPHLALRWSQLAYLSLETVVMMPPTAFATLPAGVLRGLPEAHQAYLAPYVKRVRKADAHEHDLALGQALCQILHLYAHKVLDPEHIPGPLQLRLLQAQGGLAAKTQTLRWLVEAVMSDAVKVVQVGALRLSVLIVELRRAGLRALAAELAQHYQERKDQRALRYGADAMAYTEHRAIALHHQPVAELGALATAVRDAVLRHAALHDAPDQPRDAYPLPTSRYTPVISLGFATALPRLDAQQALDVVLRDQLSAPRLGITVEEVCVRWPSRATAIYRRQLNMRYRVATSRFAPL